MCEVRGVTRGLARARPLAPARPSARPVPAGPFLVLAILLLGLSCPAARGSSESGDTVAPPVSAQAPGPSETTPAEQIDLAEISGKDSKVAELAAHRLMQSIASRDVRGEDARRKHLTFLLEQLEPARLGAVAGGKAFEPPPGKATPPAALQTAIRLVDALATWTTASGPPFPQTASIVQPLLGMGPPELRSVVVRAHQALIAHELRASKKPGGTEDAAAVSATLAALQAGLLREPPPAESYFRDAASVYWDADGRGLLGTLVAVLQLHAGSPGRSAGAVAARAALDELEARVALNLPTVETWRKWWAEVKERPLEQILADAQRRARDDQVLLWRQLLRRLRETGDAERLFLAIQDTLDVMTVKEMRLAAVVALGDYAEWVADLPAVSGPDKPSLASTRDALLSKGVERLLGLAAPRSVPGQPAEVARAALSSLARYHSFLERQPQLRERVAGLVAERIEGLSQEHTFPRADLLEALQLASALRVARVVGFVEGLIRDAAAQDPRDLELLTRAIVCLGRTLEKGLSAGVVRLLLSQFRLSVEGPEKQIRELRRACVAALSTGSEDDKVRFELRAFFKEVVWGSPGAAPGAGPRGDKDLRIPAILGLGTLARQKDSGAAEGLLEILASQEQFEAQEVTAAVDSLAYLGDRAVVKALVGALPGSKDKTVQEHIRLKILSLAESTGGSALAWAFEDLEDRARAEDVLPPLEQLILLAGQPLAREFLSQEKLDGASPERLDLFCRAALSLARARDVLGQDAEAEAALELLAQVLQKTTTSLDRVEALRQELATFRASLQARAAFRSRLARLESIETTVLVKDLEQNLLLDPSVTGRWRQLRWSVRALGGAGVGGDRLERLRTAWRALLLAPMSQGIWEGLPPGLREHVLGQLEQPAAPKAAKPE